MKLKILLLIIFVIASCNFVSAGDLDINGSLMQYHKGNSSLLDDQENYSLKPNAGTEFQPGLFGNSIQIRSEQYYSNFSWSTACIDGNYAFDFYFNGSTCSNAGSSSYTIGGWTDNSNWWWLRCSETGDQMDLLVRDATVTVIRITAGPDVADNSWHHIGVNQNATTVSLWVDGVQVGTDSAYSLVGLHNVLDYGKYRASDGEGVSNIDDAAFWCVEKESTYMVARHNSGTGAELLAPTAVADTESPAIPTCILTSPNPGGVLENFTNDVTPTGNCTITDDSTVQVGRASNDTTDSFDDMTSSRDMTSGSGDDWIWTIIGADQLVPDGNYSLCFTASDDSGNNHSTCNATMNITVDTTEPFVSIIHPIDDLTFETDNFDLNYSIYDVIIGIDKIWYNLNDGINVTITNNLTIYVSAGKYNLTLWANDSLGNINNDSVSFTSVFNLTFNGLGNLTKYEYQTNVTLLSTHNITIIVDTNVDNFSVIANTNYIYQIDTLRQNRFNDSSFTKFFNTTENFTIQIDTRTDLYNASINITGLDLSGYPIDSYLKIADNYSLLKGMLIGDILTNNITLCSATTETQACNLSFGSPGRQNFYFNISMLIVNKSPDYNITFSLSGFDIDTDNQLDFTEYFNDTNLSSSFINSTFTDLATPLYYYDNFQDNQSSSASWDLWDITRTDSRWSYNISGAGFDVEDSYLEVWCEQSKCGTTPLIIRSNSLNFRNHSMFNMLMSMSTSAGEGGAGCAEDATAYLRITDGTNTVNLVTLFASDSSDTLSLTNVTVVNNPVDSNNWDVYKAGAYSNTISTSTLSSSDWNLEWWADTSISGSCAPPSVHSAQLKLYKVELGGMALNKSDFSINYTENGTFESKILHTAPHNISAATIQNVKSSIPDGTNIIYQLSNDNGSSWEITLTDERHAFTSIGHQLRVKINMTTGDVDLTPKVLQYQVIIAPGSSANISIDIGDDGTDECTYSGILNSSFSPFNCSINPSSMGAYALSNCGASDSCLIKNKLTVADSGGIIQIHNVNITTAMNPLKLPLAYFDGTEKSGVEVGIYEGKLQIDDLKFDYRGSHNLSLDVDGTNYVLQVKYSDFNVSLPENISWYDVFPSGRQAQNVTPFGQSNDTPIWFVENLAYDEPFDVYARMNATKETKINITFSNESIKNGAVSFVLNTSAQKICSNVSIAGNCSIWNWIDLGNYTSAFYLPYYDFSTICSACVLTSGHWLTNFIQE